MAAAKKARPSADMKMSSMRNSYALQQRRCDAQHSAVFLAGEVAPGA
jgi:hypothetical protein